VGSDLTACCGTAVFGRAWRQDEDDDGAGGGISQPEKTTERWASNSFGEPVPARMRRIDPTLERDVDETAFLDGVPAGRVHPADVAAIEGVLATGRSSAGR
jgi:hypothetical protein